MRKLLTFSALLLAALALAVLALDESTTAVIAAESPQELSSTYWLRNREGWFWYRDPPAPKITPKAPPLPPSRPP